MYAEDVFVWAIGIGGALGLATALVTAILMWRHGGNRTVKSPNTLPALF